MINWKVRIRNRAFWAALIPGVLLLIQSGAAVFGLYPTAGAAQAASEVMRREYRQVYTAVPVRGGPVPVAAE